MYKAEYQDYINLKIGDKTFKKKKDAINWLHSQVKDDRHLRDFSVYFKSPLKGSFITQGVTFTTGQKLVEEYRFTITKVDIDG